MQFKYCYYICPMKLKIQLLLFSLMTTLIVSSCKKDKDEPDVQRPQIQLTSPAKDARLNSGTSFNVVAVITDDVELSQYKIEIHDNFDVHSHKKKSAPFYFSEIKDISGKEYNVNTKIEIPEDVAAGEYHLTIKAVDKAGNEAEMAELDIYIVNVLDEEPPVLDIIITPTPDAQGQIQVLYNQTIGIIMSGTDNQGLYEYKILIEREDNGSLAYEKEVEVSGTSGRWTENILIPESWPKGEYHLHIKLFDLKNNYAEVDYDVMVD